MRYKRAQYSRAASKRFISINNNKNDHILSVRLYRLDQQSPIRNVKIIYRVIYIASIKSKINKIIFVDRPWSSKTILRALGRSFRKSSCPRQVKIIDYIYMVYILIMKNLQLIVKHTLSMRYPVYVYLLYYRGAGDTGTDKRSVCQNKMAGGDQRAQKESTTNVNDDDDNAVTDRLLGGTIIAIARPFRTTNI